MYGHFYFGFVLALLSLWWSFLCTSRFVIRLSLEAKKLKIENFHFRKQIYLPEIIVKLFLYTSLVAIKYFEVKKFSKGQFNYELFVMALVHDTLILGLALAAVIELIIYYGYKMPNNLDTIVQNWVSLSLIAVTMQSHSTSFLVDYMHVLLVYACASVMFFSFMEIVKPIEIIFSFGRITSMLLLSVWLMHIEYVTVFVPDTDDHIYKALLATYFCWHTVFIILFLILEIFFVNKIYAASSGMHNLINRLILDRPKNGINLEMDYESKSELITE